MASTCLKTLNSDKEEGKRQRRRKGLTGEGSLSGWEVKKKNLRKKYLKNRVNYNLSTRGLAKI